MPGSGPGHGQGTRAPDRRARRHEETRSQILELAVAIMTDDGVAGLSMASLARALSIQPPSLYKYFPSRMAVYDALFRQGQLANLEALRSGMRGAAPGMDAVAAGMEAAGRWAVSHPVLAQLLFWRPVPGFQPTADAFAPALEIIQTPPPTRAWPCSRPCISGCSASTWPTTSTATGTTAGTPGCTTSSSPCSSARTRPLPGRPAGGRARGLVARLSRSAGPVA
jgi:AcrR family transcriptional regulator